MFCLEGDELILLMKRAAFINLLSSVFVFSICRFNYPGFWLIRTSTLLAWRLVWGENRYQYSCMN